MEVFRNWLNLFTDDHPCDRRQCKGGVLEGQPKLRKVAELQQEDKYQTDINALAQHFGVLQSGQTYTIELQDLLKICPRERRRTEAYQGLVGKLKAENIELIINSRKTKIK